MSRSLIFGSGPKGFERRVLGDRHAIDVFLQDDPGHVQVQLVKFNVNVTYKQVLLVAVTRFQEI
jgi:hypothetical protein